MGEIIFRVAHYLCFVFAVLIVATMVVGVYLSTVDQTESLTGFDVFVSFVVGALVWVGITIHRRNKVIAASGPKQGLKNRGSRYHYLCFGFGVVVLLVMAFPLYNVLSNATAIPRPNPSGATFGVLVIDVNSGSIAESIGIQKGSVIQYINEIPIDSIEELASNLRANLGKTITMRWLGPSGEAKAANMTLPQSVEPGRGVLGILLTPLETPEPPDTTDIVYGLTSLFIFIGAGIVLLLAGKTMHNQARTLNIGKSE